MSLIVIESSEDEEENDEEREKITANGRHYVESYLHTNDADRSEALNTALRARLKKQPRFLFRYVTEKHWASNSTLLGFSIRNLSAANDSATQSATEFVTINNDYCSISAKTLKREPIHRAGFSFYKRGSLRATRQVPVVALSRSTLIFALLVLASPKSCSETVRAFCEVFSRLVGQVSFRGRPARLSGSSLAENSSISCQRARTPDHRTFFEQRRRRSSSTTLSALSSLPFDRCRKMTSLERVQKPTTNAQFLWLGNTTCVIYLFALFQRDLCESVCFSLSS